MYQEPEDIRQSLLDSLDFIPAIEQAVAGVLAQGPAQLDEQCRRVIRALVPHSRTLYFDDRGQEAGLSAEALRGFERWLNRRHADRLGNRPLTLLVLPVTRDRLLPMLAGGLVYLGVARLFKVEELAVVSRLLRRRTAPVSPVDGA